VPCWPATQDADNDGTRPVGDVTWSVPCPATASTIAPAPGLGDGPGRSATGTTSVPSRVGWPFITLYAVSYTGGSLLFLAPLLVSLALKVNDLVGIDAAPRNLATVAGIGSLLAIVANPLFGRLSDRTVSRTGMRRPSMVTGVVLGAAGKSRSRWPSATSTSPRWTGRLSPRRLSSSI
jgi:MFS family permease